MWSRTDVGGGGEREWVVVDRVREGVGCVEWEEDWDVGGGGVKWGVSGTETSKVK